MQQQPETENEQPSKIFQKTFDKLKIPLSEKKQKEAEDSLFQLLTIITDMHI